MPRISGVVTNRSERQGQGKKGPWHAVNIQVNGEWYGGYLDRNPSLSSAIEGTEVALEFIENGNYKNISSIDVLKDAPKPKTERFGSAAQEEKEWHISLGAGLNQACQLIPALAEQGVIKLPAKNGFEAALEYVKEVGMDLAVFNFSSSAPDLEEEEEDNPFAVVEETNDFPE